LFSDIFKDCTEPGLSEYTAEARLAAFSTASTFLSSEAIYRGGFAACD
jgi:hypothetical protein